MVQHVVQFALGFGALVLGASVYGQSTTTVRDLSVFNRVATISAGADLSSIRLERVKLVHRHSRLRLTEAAADCAKEHPFRDPGGSISCSSVRLESPVIAYEVTYSYTGQPLTSDEYGSRYFTFSVTISPEELNGQAPPKGRISEAEAERMFRVSTANEPQLRTVIDREKSRFCDGNYVDGIWVQADPACSEEISVKQALVAADYVTVRVIPASAQVSSR